MMQRRSFALAALSLPFATQAQTSAVKIGFLVKQAEEPWFQDEWRFAEQAAKDKGFQLVTIANDAGLMAKAAREAVDITRKEGGPTAAR